MTHLQRTIEDLVNKYQGEKPLSGTLLIARNYDVIFEKAYGEASIQLRVPNTPETKFHIASLTKMFTAAAALKLHGEGRVSLNHHPGLYLPELERLHPETTIHHLLSNTSGLSDIYAVPHLRHEISKLAYDNRDFLSYLGEQKQPYPPGKRWKYSSTGFLMVAYILEKVTGQTFERLLKEMFLEPLGMKDTGQDNPRVINKNRAYGHTIVDGEYRNADNDKLSDLDQIPGELYSTARDLNQWCNAMLKGDVLAEHLSDKMFTPYGLVDFDPALTYGYGWFLDMGRNRRLIGGGTPGFRSEIFQYPEHKLHIIMLWNNETINFHELFWRINEALLH
ncbi:serine hydrolase domain-containing protein [Paenibacillus tengchongensis]|uniref:serine hydrolase domain-containing protein n=1 Tax=Paenibacillus tengchongensis TaxID=2608684 RepID=UPI001FE3333D|nr:serine hydrolase domain-containing protein [Paenibacillus tengchongensis]